MSTRTQRVEQLLRREIAGMLLRGELRDPRVSPIAAISITGVRVAPDLGSARVFVDAMGEGVNVPRVLAGLNAGAAAIRAAIGPQIRLKRTPTLRFERDESVEQGRAIERVLAELAGERAAAAPSDDAAEGGAAPSEGDEPEDADALADDDDDDDDDAPADDADAPADDDDPSDDAPPGRASRR